MMRLCTSAALLLLAINFCEGTCPIEKGFCVKSNGGDQNSGVIKLNHIDGNTKQAQATCLKMCWKSKHSKHAGATGCEVIWNQGNRGCYLHTKTVARGNGVGKHMCWIFSKCKEITPKTCPIEKGFCVKPNGGDQNSGVTKLNKVDGNTKQAQATCLKLCKNRVGATGCEVIWSQGNRGCYVHTQSVNRGNGFGKHMCWIFSKCKAENPCARWNGGCQHQCRSNGRKAVCSCKQGFKVNGKFCVDRDECTDGSSKCEQLCTNTEGSYKCGCKKGFSLAADKKSCTDLDECKSLVRRCDHICVNTAGSFKCACKKGFTLSANGKSCIATNACAITNGGCSQRCISSAGKAICFCNKKGYKLAPNGKGCLRINPCSIKKGGCAQSCVAKEGVAKCSCDKGYLQPDKKSCSPFKVLTEGGVSYMDVSQQRCASVTKKECSKIAETRGIPLRKILNRTPNRFPPGCYHKTTMNVIYYNTEPSTKTCTTKRICICKPIL